MDLMEPKSYCLPYSVSFALSISLNNDSRCTSKGNFLNKSIWYNRLKLSQVTKEFINCICCYLIMNLKYNYYLQLIIIQTYHVSLILVFLIVQRHQLKAVCLAQNLNQPFCDLLNHDKKQT